ncbi:integrase core domain-containing protein, partial [Embleya sp. NPDC005971]|uniref:integrase core domain-containing protein n=1 Tax=Embleya sp. NPDC005971 TaxID=3156724 RepID=UPI0033EC1662
IFHSDRGCQYTSHEFARPARQFGIRLSVGRTGVCWDNALAESFFSTLKSDLGADRPWPTRAAARAEVFEYIVIPGVVVGVWVVVWAGVLQVG